MKLQVSPEVRIVCFMPRSGSTLKCLFTNRISFVQLERLCSKGKKTCGTTFRTMQVSVGFQNNSCSFIKIVT